MRLETQYFFFIHEETVLSNDWPRRQYVVVSFWMFPLWIFATVHGFNSRRLVVLRWTRRYRTAGRHFSRWSNTSWAQVMALAVARCVAILSPQLHSISVVDWRSILSPQVHLTSQISLKQVESLIVTWSMLNLAHVFKQKNRLVLSYKT